MFESLGFVAVILAVILVIGAIVAGVLLLRGRAGSGLTGDGTRIGVLESIAVDARRRLVLVRRDDVEHLVMIGGPSEFVVETNIGRSGARALADGEASAAGHRAIKEAADRHGVLTAPAAVPAAALPASFTFDETELLQGLDLAADAPKTLPAELPRRRESAPVITQAHTPLGAANDQRGIREPIQRARPMNAPSEAPRDAAQSEMAEWKRRSEGAPARPAAGETNGGAIRRVGLMRPAGEERVRPVGEDRARPASEERIRPVGEERVRNGSDERDRASRDERGSEERLRPASEERLRPASEDRLRSEARRTSATRDSSAPAEQSELKRARPSQQRPEMPATRQLPSVTAPAPATNGLSTEETDIENEIVRALGMDVMPEQSQPTAAPQPPAAKAGEPRTRLGDLADRLEEALAREVRSAGHAKTRLDLDLDTYGLDRERDRNAKGERPASGEPSPSGEHSRSSEAASQREKTASNEPADTAKRGDRARPEQRQEHPPVISRSARRRDASDPLEDEMARLLGELTDGGRR